MRKDFVHIKQKSNWDCCIASVAMITRNDYETVLDQFKKIFPRNRKSGLTDPEIIKLLKSFKFKPKIINAVVLNVPAILFLPSKNEKGSHAVYFDGQEIFDPNYRVRGKKYYGRNIPKQFPEGTQAVVNLKNPITKKALLKLEKLNHD